MPAENKQGHSQNELGEVRACGCGGVNLAIGPMTLHFAAGDIEALYELATAAKDMVESANARSVRGRARRGKSKVHGTLH